MAEVSCKIGLRRSHDLSDKSSWFQVIAWCHQAPSHYLSWAKVDPDLCHHMASLGLSLWPRDAMWCQISWPTLVQVMVCLVPRLKQLTHWGPVMHICIGNLIIIGSDNGLSPSRRQAIIWTNVGILLTGPLGTNFSEISIEILIFSFKKMHLKASSAKWQPFCLNLNVLMTITTGHFLHLTDHPFHERLSGGSLGVGCRLRLSHFGSFPREVIPRFVWQRLVTLVTLVVVGAHTAAVHAHGKFACLRLKIRQWDLNDTG